LVQGNNFGPVVFSQPSGPWKTVVVGQRPFNEGVGVFVGALGEQLDQRITKSRTPESEIFVTGTDVDSCILIVQKGLIEILFHLQFLIATFFKTEFSFLSRQTQNKVLSLVDKDIVYNNTCRLTQPRETAEDLTKPPCGPLCGTYSED